MKKYPGGRDNVKPNNYKDGDIECIDAMEASSTNEQVIGDRSRTAMQYVWR